jgi:hypothetical protein
MQELIQRVELDPAQIAAEVELFHLLELSRREGRGFHCIGRLYRCPLLARWDRPDVVCIMSEK